MLDPEHPGAGVCIVADELRPVLGGKHPAQLVLEGVHLPGGLHRRACGLVQLEDVGVADLSRAVQPLALGRLHRRQRPVVVGVHRHGALREPDDVIQVQATHVHRDQPLDLGHAQANHREVGHSSQGVAGALRQLLGAGTHEVPGERQAGHQVDGGADKWGGRWATPATLVRFITAPVCSRVLTCGMTAVGDAVCSTVMRLILGRRAVAGGRRRSEQAGAASNVPISTRAWRAIRRAAVARTRGRGSSSAIQKVGSCSRNPVAADDQRPRVVSRHERVRIRRPCAHIAAAAGATTIHHAAQLQRRLSRAGGAHSEAARGAHAEGAGTTVGRYDPHAAAGGKRHAACGCAQSHGAPAAGGEHRSGAFWRLQCLRRWRRKQQWGPTQRLLLLRVRPRALLGR